MFCSKVHILGSFKNIRIARNAICSLILGEFSLGDPVSVPVSELHLKPYLVHLYTIVLLSFMISQLYF